MSAELKNTVAKNLGVPVATLEERMASVLTENREAWVASGKDEALRDFDPRCGPSLKSESAKLQRSGAEVVEGMSSASPLQGLGAERLQEDEGPPLSMDQDGRTLLIEQGLVSIVEDNLDGSYTHTVNPSFKTGSLSPSPPS